MLDAEFLSKCEVVGERQDDLPCHECGGYGDTLIIKSDESFDICHGCAKKLGIEW